MKSVSKGRLKDLSVRNPINDEIEAIRRLLKSAGGEPELHRWIRLACARPKGRPAGSSKLSDYDESVLAVAEPLQVLSRGRFTLNHVLKTLLADPNWPFHWTPACGASQEATVKRLHAKSLRDRRALAKLTKSELARNLREVKAWLESPGDGELKERVAALVLELNMVGQRRDHSD